MRLIDVDKLKKDLESATLSNGTLLNTNTVLALLDKYPTAFDVDKTIEKMEKAKTKVATCFYCMAKSYEEPCIGKNCYACCIDFLIEIVKRSVKEQ